MVFRAATSFDIGDASRPGGAVADADILIACGGFDSGRSMSPDAPMGNVVSGLCTMALSSSIKALLLGDVVIID